MELLRKGLGLYLDYKSFKAKGKIIVIESDDWGSIRTNDKATRDRLNLISPDIQNDRFSQLDNLADEIDLSALFETLGTVRDSEGRPACLTANFCTANPNFEKIRNNGFEQFFYKPFDETIREQSNGDSVLTLWRQGINSRFITPQLHGREHLHALAWMKELKAGNVQLLKAFGYESWGIPYTSVLYQRRGNLQAALDIYGFRDEEEFQVDWIKESADIFENFFGFPSKTFIAPAYTWHDRINTTLKSVNIEALQGIRLQYEPRYGQKGYKRKMRFTGLKDKRTGLNYLVRNAFFEPASNLQKDWVATTLHSIDNAFKNRQPAIIGSHRINFIGSLDESNRTRNLKMLKAVLKETVKRHPDVRFMGSDELVNEMKNSLRHEQA